MVGRPPFTMRSIPAFFSVLHLTDMVQCSRIVPPSGGRSAHVVRRRLSPCRGLRLPARMKVKPMKTSDLIEQRAAIVARMTAAPTADDDAAFQKIGRASCRERVCQYVVR